MKRTFFGAAVASFSFVGLAVAEDLESACKANADAAGVDPAACECVVDAIGGDAVLTDEYLSLGSAEDFFTSSPELQEALSSCPWE